MQYATADDVDAAFEGTVTPEQVPWVDNMISRATTRLEAIVPGLPLKVESGSVAFELVRDIVVDAVLPVLRNPSGDKSGTQAQGSFSVSRTYGDRSAAGDFVFSDAALALLRKTPFATPGRTLTVGIPAWRVP